MLKTSWKPALLAAATAFVSAGAAFAQTGQPEPRQLLFQAPATPVMERVQEFHDYLLLPIITVISLLVLGLLLWIMIRYNAKANPEPRRFSHNTLLEVIWTAVPIMILVVIAIPSFRLLYFVDNTPDGRALACEIEGQVLACRNDFPDSRKPSKDRHVQVVANVGGERRALERGQDYAIDVSRQEIRVELASASPDAVTVIGGKTLDKTGNVIMAPELTIKAVGYQWYWGYSYPDFAVEEFISNMLSDEDAAAAGEPRLLAVDNNIVVPVGATVRVLVTAGDVLHSWTVPAFGVKIDAVPGRINETWFRVDQEGVYYGQCSELCGERHAFMPIAVEVRSRAGFEAWIDEKRAERGLEPYFQTERVAAADAPVNVEQR